MVHATTSPGSSLPLRFELIAGGRSNLTYRVTDDHGRHFALRRPPRSHVLPTAHDMAREYRVISALGPTVVPVPATFGLCQDEAVNGRPFYVMEFVDGHIVRDAETAERDLDLAARRRAGESIADTLAALHAVDVDAVGLGDFAKRDGYIERQLRRWYEQFRNSPVDGVDTTTVISAVHDRLGGRHPRAGGDGHRPRRLPARQHRPRRRRPVRAVLDWEICTLGDPLADVGLLMVYWTEAGDEAALLGVTPTTVPGFPGRAEMRDRYQAASGRDLAAPRFLRGLRLLEAGLHPAGRLRPLRGRCRRRRPLERRRLRHQRRAPGRDGASGRWSRRDRARRSMTLYERHLDRVLDQPVLVVALEGWVDAGLGADGAISALLSAGPTELVATFDGESLIDQRARRPVVHIARGINEGLTWPVIQMRLADLRTDRRGRHLLPGRPRARLPLAHVRHLRGGAVPGPPDPDGRRAGRLPGAGAPHPARPPGRHRPRRRPTWWPRSASSRGRSTCPRACGERWSWPSARPDIAAVGSVGPRPPLRVGDGVPLGQCRSARRPGRRGRTVGRRHGRCTPPPTPRCARSTT